MAQKYLDNNGLLYTLGKIKAAYVAKEEGKGLSTNDYTTAEKQKLAGIAEGAQVNVLEGVKVNGVAQTVTGKAVDIIVPTKVGDLANDAGYITIDQVPEGAAASTTEPKMNGTATSGTEAGFARGDHVHPSDTTRVPVTRKVNGHALSADVTLTHTDVGAAPATHDHNTATTTAAGFMSAADKTKLDGMEGTIDNKIAALDLANTYDAKGAAANALEDAKEYTDEKVGQASNAASTAASEAKTAASAAQAAADKAQGEVDALEALVGDVTSGKTVVQMIADAKTAATYDDTQVKADVKKNADAIASIQGDYLKTADKTELNGKISTNAAAIAAINGDYLKSSDKTELTQAIAAAKQEAIEAVLDGVSDDYDTLKEVAAWIASDTTNSAALISRVTAIENDYVKASELVALTNAEIDTLFAQA